jgi:predicted O-methyltransferase YrrM
MLLTRSLTGGNVSKQQLRNRLASSAVAPVAALIPRALVVGQHNARTWKQSARWLLRSRETTNYTYDLTASNREHLAWFIANVADIEVGQARAYLDEIEQDDALRAHVQASTAASVRRGIADRDVRYGRRIGWYALVRAFQPQHVVETGTDKGLGAIVLSAALLRNGNGQLTTIDVNQHAGYLLTGRYATVGELRVGDSLAVLGKLDGVDLFLHDSDHSAAHEAAELSMVTPRLTERAVVVSDNASLTSALAEWSERHGRRFLFFDERPADHWYPGEGIGVSLPR